MTSKEAAAGKILPKILKAVFTSKPATQVANAAALGTAGYFAYPQIVETTRPRLEKSIEAPIEQLTQSLVEGGKHLNTMANVGATAVRDANFDDTMQQAKTIMLDNAADATRKALYGSLAAGGGAIGGYALANALSENPEYRMPAALLGAALVGTGTLLYPKLIKSSKMKNTGNDTMTTAEKIMTKIASGDTTGLRVLQHTVQMSKSADWKESLSNVGNSIKDWALADDGKNLKRVGTGLAAGLGTYALSSLLPGAKKNRGLRALLAGAAGLGAGAYGDKIVNGISGYLNRKPAQTPQQPAATAQKPAPKQQLPQLPTYQNWVNKFIAPGLPAPQPEQVWQPNNFGPRVK